MTGFMARQGGHHEAQKSTSTGSVDWITLNHPTDKDEIAPCPAKFDAKARPDRLVTKEQLLDSLKGSKLQIVDARSVNRPGAAGGPGGAAECSNQRIHGKSARSD